MSPYLFFLLTLFTLLNAEVVVPSFISAIKFAGLAASYYKRAALVVYKRNVTRKFKTYARTLIMANLNLGQDVANKKEKQQTAAHIVAKSFSL